MDSSLADLLKIAIPAAGAAVAALLANRRDRRQWIEKQEAEQQRVLATQADRLAAGWADMTTQAREIINRLQIETIDAKTRAAVAEERAAKLERDFVERSAKLEKELAEVRSHYAAAREELDGLRSRRGRKRETEDSTA